MKILYLIGFTLLAGCVSNTTVTAEATADSIVVISYDTVPEIRGTVKNSAVASYSEPIPDELNDWKFAVSIYETKKTFHYTIRIQAKEVRASDSLTIPNIGIQPTIEVRKGKDPFSCIIGFLDKKKEFKPYKMVSFHQDRLRVRTIASYYVGAYKTKQS